MNKIIWITLFWSLSASTSAQQHIKTFTNGSYQQIVKQYQQQQLVMVLWSIDCPPCYKELEMLGHEHNRHAFNLVLISTDGAEASNEVAAVLKKYNLQNVNSWLFEEVSAQRLRYEIDPLWYGELPRSYLFNKEHQRQAVSGVLSSEQLLK